MYASAPNCPWFGFQSDDVTKLMPICWNAGQAWLVVEMAIRARMASTVSPARSAIARKILSPRPALADERRPDRSGGRSAGEPGESGSTSGVGAVIETSTDLQLGELGDGLLLQVGGDRGEV